MHWLPLLRDIRAKKLELARLDPRAGMPVRPPPGAAPRAVAAVERRLGRPLPESYRGFLATHDGYPQLYQGASLLSAPQIARGGYVDLVNLEIDLGEASAPDLAASRRSPLLPFGIDAAAETIFAWDSTPPPPATRSRSWCGPTRSALGSRASRSCSS